MRTSHNGLIAALLVLVGAAAYGQIVAVLGTLGSGAEASSPPASNTWEGRCSADGVIFCTPFDDDGEITAFLWNGENGQQWDPSRTQTSSANVRLVEDSGCQGTGAIEIEDEDGTDEASYYWSRPLDPEATQGTASSATITTDIIGVGHTLYAQFCYWMSQEQYDNPATWDGHKVVSFTGAYNSNTDQEAFLFRNAGRKYFSAHNSNTNDDDDYWFVVDEGDYLDMQPGSEFGVCKYGDDAPPAEGCYYIEPETWYSVLYRLTVGDKATPGGETQDGTTHVQIFMARAGDESYTKIYDRSDLKVYDYENDGPMGEEGYSAFLLWNRHENHSSQSSGLTQRFSNLLVKLDGDPPPLPDWSEWAEEEPEGPTEPAYLDSMDIGFWYAMSGESPDLGLSATNTLDDIYHDVSECAVSASKFSYNGSVPMIGVGPDGLGGIGWLGAGHNHYLCNEVEAWWAATRTWVALTAPYADVGESGDWQTTGVYPDGSPSLPHTVHYLTWHPTLKKIVVPGIEVNRSGSGEIRKIALFDPETLAWSYTGSEGVRGYLGFAAYDSTRDQLIVEGSDSGVLEKLSSYAFDEETGTEGTWAHYTVKINGYDMAAAYSPDHDVMLVLHVDESVRSYNPADLSASISTITEAGTGPSVHDRAAFTWSPALGCFLAYNRGENVYKLCHTSGSALTGTWTWSVITDDENETTPPAGDGNDVGLFSRFNLLPYGEKEMVCTFSEQDGPVYCMRIASNLEAVNDDRFARAA